jgi:pimeloyl-ACP methyl ester carboxylesterase
MPVVSANGARLHVQRLEPESRPAGGARRPAVVFVHGLVIDNLSSFYYTLAGPVAAAGAPAVLYDLRGHGKSEATPHGYSAADGAADLIALLDALGLTEPVCLVGNSFGGLIAARAAIAAPARVAGLALIEACCAGTAADAWLESILNTLTVSALTLEHYRTADRFLTAGQRKIGRMALGADTLLNETSLIDDLAAERPLGPAELAGIDCPVLAVYGERSDLADGAGELRRCLPRVRVELIDGLAHTVLRDATGALTSILLNWLRDQVPAEAAGAR